MNPVRRPATVTLRAASAAAALLGCVVLAGCTSGAGSAGGGAPASAESSSASPSVPMSSIPGSATPSPGKPMTTPSVAQPKHDQVTVDITIADGQVKPNGDKIDLPLGATVLLNVTSDSDDEIHAHTGGDGYELKVKAGQPATGKFVVSDPGSFEVESHHLEKIIVILNVR